MKTLTELKQTANITATRLNQINAEISDIAQELIDQASECNASGDSAENEAEAGQFEGLYLALEAASHRVIAMTIGPNEEELVNLFEASK